MKLTALLISLLLCGCASQADLSSHQAKVGELRGRLPYLTQIGASRSMETILPPRSTQLVRPMPYQRIQSGMAVVYWPMGRPYPMCHIVWRRIGTDSWETRGMGQSGDLNGLGVLLTRENYIGVIW